MLSGWLRVRLFQQDATLQQTGLQGMHQLACKVVMPNCLCVGCAGEHGGLKLTANARAALMQRLSGAPAPTNGGLLGIPGMPSALRVFLGKPGEGLYVSAATLDWSMREARMSSGTCLKTDRSSFHSSRFEEVQDLEAYNLGGHAESLPGPPPMVPAGTMLLSKDAQALQMEQGILGPASPIPSPCLLLKNMFDPAECAPCPATHPLPNMSVISSCCLKTCGSTA